MCLLMVIRLSVPPAPFGSLRNSRATPNARCPHCNLSLRSGAHKRGGRMRPSRGGRRNRGGGGDKDQLLGLVQTPADHPSCLSKVARGSGLNQFDVHEENTRGAGSVLSLLKSPSSGSPWPMLRSPFALFQGLGKLAQLFTKSPWAKKYDTMHGRRVAMHHSYRSAAGRRLWYQLTVSDIGHPSFTVCEPLSPEQQSARLYSQEGGSRRCREPVIFPPSHALQTPVHALSAESQILVRSFHFIVL